MQRKPNTEKPTADYSYNYKVTYYPTLRPATQSNNRADGLRYYNDSPDQLTRSQADSPTMHNLTNEIAG